MKKRTSVKILALLLVLIMALCMVACNKEQQSDNSTTTNGQNASGTSVDNNTTNGTNQPDRNDNTTAGSNEQTTGDDVDEPEFYVLSGVWKFNETINLPVLFSNGESFVDSDVEFVANNEKFCAIVVGLIGDGRGTVIFSPDDHGKNGIILFSSFTGQAADDVYKTVDFGEYPQEVSKGFYEWFVANAKKVSA